MPKLFYSIVITVFASTAAWANPVESSYNLRYHTLIRNTAKDGTPVYADISCPTGETVCQFTSFNLGKVDSYDPLIPAFMDDDVEVLNDQDMFVVYQTGEIILGDHVIGRANEIVYDDKRTLDIHFTVPLKLDRKARTLVFGK